MPEQCSTCYYSRVYNETPLQNHFTCRYNAPMAIGRAEKAQYQLQQWPLVCTTDWCGRWASDAESEAPGDRISITSIENTVELPIKIKSADIDMPIRIVSSPDVTIDNSSPFQITVIGGGL